MTLPSKFVQTRRLSQLNHLVLKLSRYRHKDQIKLNAHTLNQVGGVCCRQSKRKLYIFISTACQRAACRGLLDQISQLAGEEDCRGAQGISSYFNFQFFRKQAGVLHRVAGSSIPVCRDKVVDCHSRIVVGYVNGVGSSLSRPPSRFL